MQFHLVIVPFIASSLISKADKALYRSKGEGRNRVTLYQPGLMLESTSQWDLIDAQELDD